jgi:hypothetical protein
MVVARTVLPVLLAIATCFAMQEVSLQDSLALESALPAVDEDQETEKKKEIAQDEISELAKDVEASLPKMEEQSNVVVPGKARRWHKEARELMTRLQTLHRNLLKRNWELRDALTKPSSEKKTMLPYGKIEGMLLRSNSKSMPNMPNIDACQLTCSMDRTCWSFSYNAGNKECLITPSSLGYSPDATFYGKGTNTDGRVTYHMYPGMLESTPAGKPILKTTKAACQLSCNEVAACQGFSFRASNGACSKTHEKLSYDESWVYAEKPPRTWFNGNPKDVNYMKELDDSEGREVTFLKHFKYHRDVNDKAKTQRLHAEITKIQNKARATETETRALGTEILKEDSRVADNARAGHELLDHQRHLNDKITELEGKQDVAVSSIHLIRSELARFDVELKEKRRESEKHLLQVDANGNKVKPVYQEPPERIAIKEKIAALQQGQVKLIQKKDELTTDLQDIHVAMSTNDMDQISILSHVKKAKEDYNNKKVALKLLATNAASVALIVDKQFNAEIPPAFIPIEPSAYMDSWNDKTTKADAWLAKDKMAKMEAMVKEEEAASMQMKHGKTV